MKKFETPRIQWSSSSYHTQHLKSLLDLSLLVPSSSSLLLKPSATLSAIFIFLSFAPSVLNSYTVAKLKVNA